jgi:DNA-binding NarL/FixJ family response regulator
MRILLADDHTLFAEAFKTLVERDMPDASVDIRPDLGEAHRAMGADAPYDIVLLDLAMPGMAGHAGVAATLKAFPAIKLVVISGTAQPDEARAVMQLGVRGFLPKTLSGKVIVAALRLVASGGTYLPAEYASAPVPGAPSPDARLAGLTSKEADVLRHLAAGKTNKEIGSAMALQEITIKLHVRNIFKKLGVRNRVQATIAMARLPGFGGGAAAPVQEIG